MAFEFLEFVQSVDPPQAAFSMEGGRASLQIDIEDAEALGPALRELLGDCAPAGDGALARVLPTAHPQWPWLFCERVTAIQGLKPQPAKTPAEDFLEAPPLANYQRYDRYRLTCEFTPRPYRILSDDRVKLELRTVYDDDDGSSVVTTAQEWLRYIDVIAEAKPELITAQHGQMVFYTNGAVVPSNEAFSGFPRIYLPNGTVMIRWYQVPESYVYSANSHIRKWIGRVNQAEFLRWQPGELLYKGYTQRRYTPPFPSVVPDPNKPTVFGNEKLVDVELLFDETKRTAGTAYTTDNRNHISGGHNLQPYLRTRKFYYAGAKATTLAARVPTHLSFETRLLFTDPDI